MNKSKSAFKTIAEVASELGVATHVLRFWETKFKEISPMKTSSGRRYYRPDDVELIKLIKDFLYNKRYTIEGVQKVFKQYGVKSFLNGDIQKDFFAPEDQEQNDLPQVQEKIVEVNKLLPSQIEKLNALREDLLSLQDELKAAL
ncbi:MAG: MerR family transcriptional regulator [Alphaproteobacteria bacterium]|nr:MerR family transcriptional regulator [Alphaproteobacteria bacterium]